MISSIANLCTDVVSNNVYNRLITKMGLYQDFVNWNLYRREMIIKTKRHWNDHHKAWGSWWPHRHSWYLLYDTERVPWHYMRDIVSLGQRSPEDDGVQPPSFNPFQSYGFLCFFVVFPTDSRLRNVRDFRVHRPKVGEVPELQAQTIHFRDESQLGFLVRSLFMFNSIWFCHISTQKCRGGWRSRIARKHCNTLQLCTRWLFMVRLIWFGILTYWRTSSQQL